MIDEIDTDSIIAKLQLQPWRKDAQNSSIYRMAPEQLFKMKNAIMMDQAHLSKFSFY